MNKKINQYRLKITTISRVFTSPRANEALYKGIDFPQKSSPHSLKISGETEYSVIYPFYRQQDPNFGLNTDRMRYYIPASSIKGALAIQKEEDRRKIFCSDIFLEEKDICLGNVYKFQYIMKEEDSPPDQDESTVVTKTFQKSPQYEVFFPNVGMEMIERQVCCQATIRVNNADWDFGSAILRPLHCKTINKLENYQQELKKLERLFRQNQNQIQNQTAIQYLTAAKDNIDQLLHQANTSKGEQTPKYLMFLGGYKGKLAANSNYDSYKNQKDIRYGLYFDHQKNTKEGDIDPKSLLPYGLVQVQIREGEETTDSKSDLKFPVN